MLYIFKNFKWTILISFFCIFLGVLTFLTFINVGFVPLTDQNLQILLICDLILLLLFFTLIFRSAYSLYIAGKRNKIGAQTNLRYISLFSLFTFIPSLLVAVFSLFIFNFGIQNYFNDQISKAVNNSYGVAKNYLEDSKKTVLSDIILMSVGINRASGFYYNNPTRFMNIVKSEKILRRVDDVYLIDGIGNIILKDVRNVDDMFISPTEENFNIAIEGLPVVITNNQENKTSSMIKLNSLIDTYLYISRNIDNQILQYLTETKEAVEFYYSVENKQLGIKITFAIIYIIVVTLVLFLSTVLAILFSARLTKPIINLISASEAISAGKLNTKVPLIETDKEFHLLNKNFNNMIDRLKKQQGKLLSAERFSAWEDVARKLAHEIKNPLTPIQLSIDRLKEKYESKILDGKEDFKQYLETINRQIKDIEKLVNEFSNFARMPEPQLKKINIYKVLNRAIEFSKMSSKNSIRFNFDNKDHLIKGDEDQLYRVFINLIKNAEESINEKRLKNPQLKGNIVIELMNNNDYTKVTIKDNGIGISDLRKVMTPYSTTKKDGTGLGLPIVEKIIIEHGGEINLKNAIDGAEVIVNLSNTKS